MKKLILSILLFFPLIVSPAWVGATDTGAHSPGTTSEIDSGSHIDWANTDNVKVSDNVWATSTIGNHVETETILATNFAFDVPVGATIVGILVQCEVSTTGEAPGAIKELNLQMYRDGAAVGSNLANTTEQWHGGTDEYYSSGGATNLWGTTWTATQINDIGTGVIFSAKSQDDNSETARVDHIKITVYYTTEFIGNLSISSGPALQIGTGAGMQLQ